MRQTTFDWSLKKI